MRVAGDLEATAVDPAGREPVVLVEQDGGVDDDAVADHRRDVRIEDAAGDQLESERLTVDDHGVAGVVAALVADDHAHLFREQVGELRLAFVSPLRSDDDGGRHVASS